MAVNEHTDQLRLKGYSSLKDGLLALDMGLRTFRRWSKENPDQLTERIKKLNHAKNTIANGSGWLGEE